MLDRTAFYPTSGGQPFDTGMLGDVRVLEVEDADDGEVVHIVEGDVGPGVVHGRIDWERRFEHMQQHTGQHVLSAAFDRVLKVPTVSFHLGTASSTIDLAREVSAAEIARAEREANRVVWEDRPVAIRFADAAEAATLGLRKESKREGVLRLIDVENFDVSACGGTHVARTGAIGVIAVAGAERFKGATRLEFLCGGRALAGYHALRDSVAGSVRLLSVLPAELPSAIERAQAEARELRGQIKDLHGRLAEHEAAALIDSRRARRVGACRRGRARWMGRQRTQGHCVDDCRSSRTRRHPHQHADSRRRRRGPRSRRDDRRSATLKKLTAQFGGKGGGRPELAQGGGLQGDVEEMLRAARTFLTS